MDLTKFWDYVKERDQIWIRKRRGDPWPWTENKILQEYSFTNVLRERDRVSQQLQDIYSRHDQNAYRWFLCCLGRQINWPPTIKHIIQSKGWVNGAWYPEVARQAMLELAAKGMKIYTGAYMIKGDGTKKGGDKPEYTCQRVLGPVWARRDEISAKLESNATLQHMNEYFQQFEGWGGFMAQECLLDIQMMKWFNPPDREIWAFAGPGAVRGLNRLLGVDVKAPMKQDKALDLMRRIRREIPKPLLQSLRRYTVHDVEFNLCEFDKLLRVENGEGRPRSKYHRKDEE